MTFGAILSPDNEIPPVASPSNGSGQGFFVLDTDTNLFTWSIAFQDLTGPNVAPGAHIHAQAAGTEPGAAAGPIIIDFNTDPGAVVTGLGASIGTYLGRTTLSNDPASSIFVGGLLDGLWYVNIHTALNQPGEIRGQILPGGVTVVPLPAAAWLLFTALGFLALRARPRSA